MLSETKSAVAKSGGGSKFKKFIIWTTSAMLVLNVSFLTGFLKPEKAMAAPTVDGGAPAVVSIGNPPVALSIVSVVEGLPNDFTTGSPPTNGIQVTISSNTLAQVRFSASTVTVNPSGTLGIGAGTGMPQTFIISDGASTIDIPIITTNTSLIENFTLDGIKVDATTSGTSANFAGSEHLIVTVAGGAANGADFTVDAQLPIVTSANIDINHGRGASLVLPEASFIIGDTITVTWDNTASGDNNTDITSASVDFSQFGGSDTQPMSNTGGIWTASYEVVEGNNNADGRHVSVTATDINNNSNTTQDGANRSIENTLPQSSFTSTPPAFTKNPTPSFAGTANDPGIGAQIANIKYRIVSPSSVVVDWTDANLTNSPYDSASEDFTIGPVSSLADNDYTLEIKATDAAGNIGNTITYAFAIVTQKPEITSFSATSEDGSVHLSWNPVSYPDHYDIYRSSSSFEYLDTVYAPQTSYTDSTVERGESHQYKIIAVNKAGIESDAVTISIVIPALPLPISLLPIAQAAPEQVAPPAEAQEIIPPVTEEGKILGGEEENGGPTNWTPLIVLGALVILFLAGYFGWRWYGKRETTDRW